MKKEFSAGTSASIAASPMLSAALSVKDGNKLIAEFMGFISDKTNVYRVPNLFPFKGYESGYTEFSVWAIGFEKDWNMLMPVVEKIRSLSKNFLFLQNDKFTILRSSLFGGFEIKADGFDITAAWNAITRFIQWHNLNTVAVGSR